MWQLLCWVYCHIESRIEKRLAWQQPLCGPTGRLFSLLYLTETDNRWSHDGSWQGPNCPFCSNTLGRPVIITTGDLATLAPPRWLPTSQFPKMHQYREILLNICEGVWHVTASPYMEIEKEWSSLIWFWLVNMQLTSFLWWWGMLVCASWHLVAKDNVITAKQLQNSSTCVRA